MAAALILKPKALMQGCIEPGPSFEDVKITFLKQLGAEASSDVVRPLLGTKYPT